MMTSIMQSDATTEPLSKMREWELGPYQRSLADNCFEEGQYEAAISMLAQLRSSQYRPSMPHIRQLIFIALHPADKFTDVETERQVLESPRKLQQTKVSSRVTPQAVTAALHLLTSLIHTNSPDALGRALPYHHSPDNQNTTSNDENSDSLLAKQALCIRDAKNCWELLGEGFLARAEAFTSPKGKSKMTRDHSIDGSSMGENVSENHGVIGHHSWPMLNWLISLFENDEAVTHSIEQVRYSPLFLAQIPLPRGPSLTRWDLAAILDIVFSCLKQPDLRRQRMGYRIMTLMVNMTSTVHVDLSTLVSSIYKRLLTSSIGSFPLFFSNLETSPALQRFKLFLSLKYLTDSSLKNDPLQEKNRPRPQARPPPKSRLPSTSNVRESPVAISRSQSIKETLPNCSEIVRALTSPVPDPLPLPGTRTLMLQLKFELVLQFDTLQPRFSQDAQSEWKNVVQDGTLFKFAFGREQGEEAPVYLQMLQQIMSDVKMQ